MEKLETNVILFVFLQLSCMGLLDLTLELRCGGSGEGDNGVGVEERRDPSAI